MRLINYIVLTGVGPRHREFFGRKNKEVYEQLTDHLNTGSRSDDSPSIEVLGVLHQAGDSLMIEVDPYPGEWSQLHRDELKAAIAGGPSDMHQLPMGTVTISFRQIAQQDN